MRSFSVRSAALRLTPLLMLAAAACGDERGASDPLAPAITPNLEIRDAARGGAVPGFYFLTPIAATLPSYPGVFAPDHAPVVEICEWAGSACAGQPVARFTMTEGTAGRTIRVEAAAQAYRVDWVTTAIPAGRTYRIQVRDGIWDLGHADARRPAAGESPTTLKAQGIVPIGNASAFPIRFRIERNAAPMVAITAPVNDVIVPAGTPFTLAGTASDAEEGDLSASIVWRSSQLPSPLGSGASLQVSLPSGRHVVSASVTDARGATTTTSIGVVASIISAPAQLNVPFGGTASIPVTLSEPAPAGGLALAVTSSAPGTAALSHGVVTIPAGALSANATLSGVQPGTATVTAANPDYGMAVTQVTVTAQLDVTVASVSFAQGRVGTITVKLQSGGSDIAAPAGGLQVRFTPVDAGCALAAPVTIPAGQVSATAEVVWGGTAATPCATDITAAAPDVAGVSTDVFEAKVGAAPSLSMSAARVGASLQTSLTLSLGTPAPAGGLQVELESADPSILLVSDAEATPGAGSATITVAAGSSSHTIYLQGVSGRSGAVAVTATAPGYATGTTTHVVAQSGVELVGPAATANTFSANESFYARLGVLNAAGTGIASHQKVRAGNGPVVVTIANSDAAVAQLVRTSGASQVVTVQVAEGENNSPTSVAAGGVAIDPIGGGTTTVTATAPGFTSMSGATRTMTVSAPQLSVGGTRVGAGLQTSINVSFGASTPAELPLTVTSSDPGILLLADTEGGPGVASRTITIPAGQSSRTIHVRGVPGTTGSATITATLPGFTTASGTTTVGATALEIVSLSATGHTLSANNAFYVRVGVLNAAGTGFSAYQDVQPGAGAIPVTLTNANAAVGQLVRGGQAGQTTTLDIPEGAQNTPTTVGAGGVAFDYLGAGTTTVTATAPGMASVSTSSRTVTVSAPQISVGETRVGAGLQTSVNVNLGANAPAGGLELSIANSNPALLQLATSATGASADALTIQVPAGTSSTTIYLRGATGQTGSATLTASAPGFSGASGTQAVGPSAVEIVSLDAATTTLSPNDEFYVRVGVLNAAGTGFSAYQHVRHDGGPLTVTLTNGDATVGQLVRGGTSGQSVTVQVPEGSQNSPTTVAAGGVALDPLGGGTTVVTASAPSFVPFSTSSRTVTVSAPKLTVGEARVGAGLQTSVTISLGAPAPAGGLELALSSSAADVLLLAATADGPGAGALTLAVAAGKTTATVYLRGAPARTGTAIITASAPGFTNGTGAQAVARSALEFVSLPASTTAGAANGAFYVRVGVLNAAGTGFSSYQHVQHGGGPLEVTLANSNAAVAQLVRTAGPGQVVTVQIAEGESNSPTSVASGGVAFDPTGAGSTTVAATATSQPSVAGTSKVVTVAP